MVTYDTVRYVEETMCEPLPLMNNTVVWTGGWGGGRGERREATIKAREKVGERCKGAQVGGKTSGKTERWASLQFCPLTWGAEILEAINIVAIRERGL